MSDTETIFAPANRLADLPAYNLQAQRLDYAQTSSRMSFQSDYNARLYGKSLMVNTEPLTFICVDKPNWIPGRCVTVNTEPVSLWGVKKVLKTRNALSETHDWFVRCYLAAFKAACKNDLSRPLMLTNWFNKVTSPDEEIWKQWHVKLQSLQNLTEGWNGYSAPAPNAKAIENAKTFLEVMQEHFLVPTRIAASVIGGVGITRRQAHKKVFVEFFNSGLIGGLFANDNDQTMRTFSIQAEWSDFERFLSAAEDYLSG